MLHVPALAAQQHFALAPQRAQHTHLLGRAKRPAEQAVGHQLLQPLAVQHVGLAPRDVLDVARVDQQHREAARLEQLKQSNPVHPGGFHRHRIHPAGLEPIGQGVQVDGEAGKLAFSSRVSSMRSSAIPITSCRIGVMRSRTGTATLRVMKLSSIQRQHHLWRQPSNIFELPLLGSSFKNINN
jgi:hypothetical protein